MNKNDIDKAYVSPYDKFLFAFDATHAPTPSQIREREKAQAIALKRDDENYAESTTEIWESF